MERWSKSTKTRYGKSLKGYSALAAATMMLASHAQAKVVYTDANPDDAVVYNQLSFDIDLNGDGISELSIENYSFGTEDWAAVIAGSLASNGDVFGVYSTSSGSFQAGNVAIPLSQGAAIGSTVSPGSVGSWQTGSVAIGYSYYGSQLGQWPADGLPHYLGVRFQILGALHYGWVRLSLIPSGVVLVHSYAYEDVANTPITTAGDPFIPGDTDGDGKVGLPDILDTLIDLTGPP